MVRRAGKRGLSSSIGPTSSQALSKAGETAVGAIVHALVGHVKRSEQPHRLAEILPGRPLAPLREGFQRHLNFRQSHEPPHQRRRVGEDSGIVGGKRHAARVEHSEAGVQRGFVSGVRSPRQRSPASAMTSTSHPASSRWISPPSASQPAPPSSPTKRTTRPPSHQPSPPPQGGSWNW